jgi:thioredoxin reductase (NADPH)
VHFSRYAGRVTMLVRGDSLAKSMSHYLIEQIAGINAIELHPHTQVVGGSGGDHLERLTLVQSVTGEKRDVDTSYLFVFIGAEPRTEWLERVVARDEDGFVITGPDLLVGGKPPAGWPLPRSPYLLETSLPGVFAAGDVRAQSVKRVASAVGEGAMAVSVIHRYLEAQ